MNSDEIKDVSSGYADMSDEELSACIKELSQHVDRFENAKREIEKREDKRRDEEEAAARLARLEAVAALTGSTVEELAETERKNAGYINYHVLDGKPVYITLVGGRDGGFAILSVNAHAEAPALSGQIGPSFGRKALWGAED